MNQEKWDKIIKREEIQKQNSSHCTENDMRTYVFDKFLFKEHTLRNSKVLDIGCEVGSWVGIFQKVGLDTYGITLNESDIERSKKNQFIEKDKEIEVKNIIAGDMHEMPFEDGFFDIAVCMHTIEHSPSPVILLKEINRILKIGGKLILSFPEEGDFWTFAPNHYFCFTIRQAINLLNKFGFRVISSLRIEKELSDTDAKRDLVFYAEKIELSDDKMGDNYALYPAFLPFFGSIHMDGNIKVTPIFMMTSHAPDKNIYMSRRKNDD